jgi:sarcosine oxidase gamma subunit
MSSNGRRKPPRPQIEIVQAASEPEAAAIAAALERFLAETPPASSPGGEVSRWQQAALREGVNRDPGAHSWGAT